MRGLNQRFAAAIDALMRPLAGAPPMVSLALLALVTAAGMLLVFKVTIDRKKIEASKNRIHAALFEMRLFNDDIRAVLRAAGDVVRANGSYLRAWLIPMLIVGLPFVWLVAHLEGFYGYGGLALNRPALLTVTLRSSGASGTTDPAVTLEAPPAIRVDTPALWFPAAHQVIWRISPRQAGQFALRLRTGRGELDKALTVSDDVVRRSPTRPEAGFLNELDYPSEPPLDPGEPISSIEVEYPVRDIAVFGRHVHWLVPYIGLTLLFAFALKRPFGVTL